MSTAKEDYYPHTTLTSALPFKHARTDELNHAGLWLGALPGCPRGLYHAQPPPSKGGGLG